LRKRHEKREVEFVRAGLFYERDVVRGVVLGIRHCWERVNLIYLI